MKRRLAEPDFLARQARVLAFFGERLPALPLHFDDALDDHGVATADGVALGPTALGAARESSVLAHELFHYWTRTALPPAELHELSCLAPRFAASGATLEELAAEALARRLCARSSAPFVPSYAPPEVPPHYLERAVAHALQAVAAARLFPLAWPKLHAAREALEPLSGHDLAALAFAEALAGERRARWPQPLWAEVAALHRDASLAVEELAAPQLLRGLSRFLGARRWNDRRRGPLWPGDSPLELPGRLLEQRARAGSGELRDAVVTFLEAMTERLRFLAL